jgi:hypothetical protein
MYSTRAYGEKVSAMLAAGEPPDVLLVTEEMVAVYYYGVMPEGGRFGYLYQGVDPDFAQWREQSGIGLKQS